jgi:hypothetical protein
MLRYFILLFVSLQFMGAQQRYVVTPLPERSPDEQTRQMPIPVVAPHSPAGTNDFYYDCSNHYPIPPNTQFGYPLEYMPFTILRAYHKDVIGQWYVVPYTGTIDTIFWYSGHSIGAADSLINIRIYESNIGPDYGPGVRDPLHGSNFPPPCARWGYWNNAFDSESGITPFPEEATDTTWISTIQNSPMATRPPIGHILWGGADVVMRPSTICAVTMASIGAPVHVTAGQKIFITMRVNGDGTPLPEQPTEWYLNTFQVTPPDLNYPSRAWKFRENGPETGVCGGIGWNAIGALTKDSMQTAVFNIWFSMTIEGNIPPEINEWGLNEEVQNTLSNAPQTVQAEIRDCDPSVPGFSGEVASAVVAWSKAKITAGTPAWEEQPDIPMTAPTPPLYTGNIPGQQSGTIIQWRIKATDNKGLITLGPIHNYKILSIRNGYYYVDTNFVPIKKPIVKNTHIIEKNEFFIDTTPPQHGNDPGEDGTAGPFDMGGEMKYFGKDVRYAWVGINGALALSAERTDTIDVNANGRWNGSWEIPGLQRRGRSDIVGADRLPRNYVSPINGNLRYFDSSWTYGILRTGLGPDTSCEFVVEWDTMTVAADYFPSAGGNFRVILNHCDNTIEFQYDDLSDDIIFGLLAETALTGIEGDADSATINGPNPPYVSLCENGYPMRFRPSGNDGFRFIPISTLTTAASWNLLSISTVPESYDVAACYPDAVPPIQGFAYSGRYVSANPVQNGPAYWIKFPAPTNGIVYGRPLDSTTISIAKGWNMIGSITYPVPVSAIVFSPNVSLISNYFDYLAGYHPVSTIQPGYGYWVKVNLTTGTSGTMTLKSSPGMMKQSQPDEMTDKNSITIRDKFGRSQTLWFTDQKSLSRSLDDYEMPPAGMDFDARFTSGRILETYPSAIDSKTTLSYPISTTSIVYPLTISWNIIHPVEGCSFGLSNGKAVIAQMEKTGSVEVKDARALALTLGKGANLPKETALGAIWPNPFNPTTQMYFVLSTSYFVTIKIYDVLGREAATLVNGPMEAGEHSVRWDAYSAPSGVYFVRMTAGNYTAVKRIILLK